MDAAISSSWKRLLLLFTEPHLNAADLSHMQVFIIDVPPGYLVWHPVREEKEGAFKNSRDTYHHLIHY